ncbi:MAG: sortase [Cellulomonadaceae bacterium]|jgi:sortase A|nr:sortase [Cellulomonadaceae bacterium]
MTDPSNNNPPASSLPESPESPAQGSVGRRARKAQRAAAPRKTGRVRRAVGWLLIVAAVVTAGRWGWDTFGTTWWIQKDQHKELDSFALTLPSAPSEYGQLHTDFVKYPPPDMDLASVATGDPFGLLTIPRWQGQEGVYGETLYNKILIKQGAKTQSGNTAILNTAAAAHYIDTADPGQIGNFAISAHRRSYGDNFLRLNELEKGDFAVVETAGAWYVYQVLDHSIVLPSETYVINPDPYAPVDSDGTQQPTRRLITMTTCTLPNGSPWGNTRRWIVHGELYGWMEREAGVPPQIEEYWDAPNPTETKACNASEDCPDPVSSTLG